MVAGIDNRRNIQKSVTAGKKEAETPRKAMFIMAAETEILPNNTWRRKSLGCPTVLPS
jgi:hypothetical protein